MKAVSSLFNKSVLRELDKQIILTNATEIRKTLGDRALLRSLHFFDENERVDIMTAALAEMENAAGIIAKQNALNIYLDMVNESGDSSWKLLQNVYSSGSPETQGISTALALTKDFIRKQKLYGACRVHGGGFAGTIQTYLPLDSLDVYRTYIETVFGSGSVTKLMIRSIGAVELFFN
jgi:galactokinase